MNKICTSLEQSKKLLELGIDVNTADMWWAERYEGRVTENGQYLLTKEPYYYLSLIKPSDINYSQDSIKDIPAWSLTALLDMLDYEVVDVEGESCYLKIDKDDIEYQIRYEDRWNSGIETKWYDNPLDAAFEMVCWLKENGKI